MFCITQVPLGIMMKNGNKLDEMVANHAEAWKVRTMPRSTGRYCS